MITRIQEVQRQPASGSPAWLPPRNTAALQRRGAPRPRRHDSASSAQSGQQPALAAALPPCSGGGAGRRHRGSVLVRSSSQPAKASQPAEAAVPAAAPIEQVKWRTMLLRAWGLLQRQLWPLVVAHAATDTAVFLLHRFSHRATNEAAVVLLGGGMLTRQAIGNMWYLSVNPAIANFQTGYQLLTFLFFLLAFPLNVYIKTWASVATILLCQQVQQAWAGSTAAPAAAAAATDQKQVQQALQQQQEKDQQAQPPQEQQQQAQQGGGDGETPAVAAWWQPRRGLQQAVAALGPLQAQIAALWRPVFLVELLVAVVVVPLQFASLVVVTLPLTLPIILDLQAAGPVAAAEGARGMDAVKRSRQMLRPLRWQLAVPFVGLLLAGRLLQAAKEALLNAMPTRFFSELPEIPLAVAVGGTVLSVLIARLQDVLPFVAWEAAAGIEARKAEAVMVQSEQTADGAATAELAADAARPAEHSGNGAASSATQLSK